MVNFGRWWSMMVDDGQLTLLLPPQHVQWDPRFALGGCDLKKQILLKKCWEICMYAEKRLNVYSPRETTVPVASTNTDPEQAIGIPHISHIFYTTTIWGVEILHLKVRKFATRDASRQNSVNYHLRTQILNCLKLWYECWIVSQITHYVRLQGGWNTTPSVKLHHL